MKLKSKEDVLVFSVVVHFGLIVVILALLGLASWYITTRESSEATYQRTTSAEAKAAHVAMAERLKTATRGDFVIQMDKSNRQIPRVVTNDPGKQEESWRINLETADWSGVSSYNADSLARNVIRIVRKTDSDWAEVAKKFFEQ